MYTLKIYIFLMCIHTYTTNWKDWNYWLIEWIIYLFIYLEACYIYSKNSITVK